MEPQATQFGSTLRDRLRVVFRHRRLLVLGSMLFAIVALQAAYYLPVRYSGTARFERKNDPSMEEGMLNKPESFESIKLTLQHELAGYEAVDGVVTSLEQTGVIAAMPRDEAGRLTPESQRRRQELVDGLVAGIDVKWEVRSPQVDLLAVSFTHSNPALASDLPNLLVHNYIDKTSGQILDRLKSSKKFLEEQVAASRGKVKQLQETRTQYVTENAGMFPDSPGGLQDRIMRLQAQIDATRMQNSLARKKLENVRLMQRPVDQMELTPTEVIKAPNHERRALEREVQGYRDELKEKYTDKHPQAIVLKEKIEKLEKRVAEMPQEIILEIKYSTGFGGAEMAVQEIQLSADIAVTDQELRRDVKLLETYQALQNNLAPIRQKYDEMTKYVDEAEKELTRWQARLTDIDMSLKGEVGKNRTHLKAVETAKRQGTPSSPTVSFVLGSTMGGALAFAIVLAFFCHTVDRTIRTTDEAVSEFNLQVHGVIGEIISPARRASMRVGLFLTSIFTAMVVAVLAINVFSVVLWLQYPDLYTKFKGSPLQFIWTTIFH